jgi:hypothetical protein
VTDEIEAPTDTYPAPIITPRFPRPNQVLRFNAFAGSVGQLVVPLKIDDLDLQRTLKLRWRVINTLSSTDQDAELDYLCPELPIPPSGSITRADFSLTIPATKFEPNSCNHVEIVVSDKFFPCTIFKGQNSWDFPTSGRSEDVGRATFMVWEDSGDPVQDSAAAVMVTSTCRTAQYVPPSNLAPTPPVSPNTIPAMEK